MPLAVTLLSAVRNLSPDRRMSVHILSAGLDPVNVERLTRSVADERLTLRWVHVDPADFAGLPLWGRMTAATYFKLALPRILPAEAVKVIWLDSDLLVLGDLAQLIAVPLQGKHVAAVQDPLVPLVSSQFGIVGYRRLGLPAAAKYFNAGIMLIDVGRWRDDDIAGQATAYLKGLGEKVFFWDQEGLNAALALRWLELDPRWNTMPGLGGSRGPRASGEEPWIVHFAGRQKPWTRFGRGWDQQLYYRYLGMTAWASSTPQPTLGGSAIDWYGRSKLRTLLYPAEGWAIRLAHRLSARRRPS